MRLNRRRWDVDQVLPKMNQDHHWLWREVDHDGGDRSKYAGWSSVAFASYGIPNCGRRNKINNLRPREGSKPVAFPPPVAFAKGFSRRGFGQSFLLFSRVMRDGLLTGVPASGPGSVLSGSIFSGPVARVVSVNNFQAFVFKVFIPIQI